MWSDRFTPVVVLLTNMKGVTKKPMSHSIIDYLNCEEPTNTHASGTGSHPRKMPCRYSDNYHNTGGIFCTPDTKGRHRGR